MIVVDKLNPVQSSVREGHSLNKRIMKLEKCGAVSICNLIQEILLYCLSRHILFLQGSTVQDALTYPMLTTVRKSKGNKIRTMFSNELNRYFATHHH